MITDKEVKEILMNSLNLAEVYVTSDGSHFQVIAVDNRFAEMTRLKKQQIISEPLAQYIASNDIHALSIKVFTLDEWKRHRLLNGL